MKGAGLTQGAFYKQFASKEDLEAQASKRAMESAIGRWSAAAATDPQQPFGTVLDMYLSMDHRGERMDGCPVVALGSDAAREGVSVKASFEAGIKDYLELIGNWAGKDGAEDPAKAKAILATMIGAVLLSRVVNAPELVRQLTLVAVLRPFAVAKEVRVRGHRCVENLQ